ncbi:MAG: zinc ribbon domain-containing protein [Sphingomonadales bacterium]|jgi:predicted  nucleic acid-binding Zn-ribbon protein
MDISVQKKLTDLWTLQKIDSRLNGLRALLGELPMEVADLEDSIVGLETRVSHIQEEIAQIDSEISDKRNSIKDFNRNIEKYDDQLNNIKNSREFEAIEKEKEIAGLEILQAEKKIRELGKLLDIKKELLDKTTEDLGNRKKDLEFKQSELAEIEKENQEEIEKINVEREKAEASLDDRYKRAYNRIRENMRNGIAVAPILRGSCGGCFSKIPPQRHSDIRAHFRIIDCEHCGRLLVDQSITGLESVAEVKEEKATRRKIRLTAKAE